MSGGRTTVGEYLHLNGVAYAGNGCSPNGLQGRAVDGSILSCTNGVWKEGGGSVNRMFIIVEGSVMFQIKIQEVVLVQTILIV